VPNIASAEDWYACYNATTTWNVYYRVIYWMHTEKVTQGVFITETGEISCQHGEQQYLGQNFLGYFFHPSSKAPYFALKDVRHEVKEDI
jgi:hypothetical protein